MNALRFAWLAPLLAASAAVEILGQSDVAKRLEGLSAETIASTPAGMAAIMKEDAERWRSVIRAAGVKPD